MAVQSSDSQESSSSSSQQKEEVNTTTATNKKVDDSSSSEEEDSSEKEKGVESESGSDPRSSSVIKIKNKLKEEEVNNTTTTTNNKKVDSSSSSSSEDESEEEKGLEEKDESEEEEESHIANQKGQEKQKSEDESDKDEEAKEDDDEEEESRRRSNQEIRMENKNDVVVLIASSINENYEKVSEPEEEEPNAIVVFNPHTDKTAKTQSSSKRPLEEEKEEDISNQGGKKMKVAVAGDSSKSKSKFDKIFTDDDELVIMKGLVDLNSKNKRFPRYNQLTDLIKPSISFPVTSRQISEKVRRVNKKYRSRNANPNKGGKEMKSTPHELEVFELCEKIWGGQNQSTYNKERGIKKRQVEENSKIITFLNDYLGNIMAIGGGRGGGAFPHIDLGVFDEEKRAYFAKKLKALVVKELELYSEKAELASSVVEELKPKKREAAI